MYFPSSIEIGCGGVAKSPRSARGRIHSGDERRSKKYRAASPLLTAATILSTVSGLGTGLPLLDQPIDLVVLLHDRQLQAANEKCLKIPYVCLQLPLVGWPSMVGDVLKEHLEVVPLVDLPLLDNLGQRRAP